MNLTIFDNFNLRARISVIIFFAFPLVFDFYVFWGAKFSITEDIIISILLVVLFQGLLNIIRPTKSILSKNYAVDLLLPTSELSEITKKRYYRKLSQFEPEFTDFNCDEEERNNKITKSLCESAICWLRAKTRDKTKFPLVIEENINYSYLRNIYYLKIPGIVLNSILLFVLGYLFCFTDITDTTLTTTLFYLQTALHILSILYLCFIITKNRLIKAAEKYSKALLEAIDLI